MKKTTLFAALGLLATVAFEADPAQAAATEAWVQRYSNVVSNSNDQAIKVVRDAAGDIVVTGTTDGTTGQDMLTIKYSGADGSVLWQKQYNGPSNSLDQTSAVAVDASGNVIVTGVSDAEPGVWGLLLGGDDYTAKYAAADGALLWQKRHKPSSGGFHAGPTLAVDGSGNVVVTGYSERDNYTAKYGAADGTLLWEKHYSSPRNSEGGAIPVTVDGSGNVVVAGSSSGTNGYDYYTAKYGAADGTLLWEQRYNSPANGDGEVVAVAVDVGGNVVVTGYSRNSSGNLDYYTAKYAAANGALLWGKRYNGLANAADVAVAVVVDGSGNVVVTGYSNDTDGDYYTAKYAAADGVLLWEKRSNGGGRAVAADSSGNVVVTGCSGGVGYFDYYTAKYAAADGALLWEKRYNGPANGNDNASSLALGPNGMVAITGTSSGDYATVVYWESLPPVSIALVPAGVRLRFIGVPGRSYTIERAPTVTDPWITLAAPTAPIGGLIEYVDTNPPVDSAFYRTMQP